MSILNKPNTLKPGDTIGIINPSSAVAEKVPHRIEKGIKMLESMGFKVVVGKNAFNSGDYVAGTPQERAHDINTFFADPNIKGLISFIGGFHSNQILKYLDFEIIKNNPKIFMGYSDITVLHWALHTKGHLVTFYGPAILTQFAENPEILPYTKEYFLKATTSNEPIGKIEASKEWTDEILNWFEKKDLERPRNLASNPGWTWLKSGNAEGQIVGGCITSMLHLRGTEFWPDLTDKIFFWELPDGTSFNQGESVEKIDAHLTDLELSGVFKKIKGMIVGRPFSYSKEQVNNLKKVILERTKDYNFPILFGIDIGHTDPMITIPLGVNVKLNSDDNLFEFTEAGVK